MVTDIDGVLEVRPGGPGWAWVPVEARVELTSDYDAFGCLFGVCNFAGFVPVAADRGVPPDASAEVRNRAVCKDNHSHTWITAAELAGVDWEQPAATVDARIHEYKVTNTTQVFVRKAGWSRDWAAIAGASASSDETSYAEGSEWRDGDRLWRVVRLRRHDVLRTNPELRRLLERLTELGARHGVDNARLVVWFDS